MEGDEFSVFFNSPTKNVIFYTFDRHFLLANDFNDSEQWGHFAHSDIRRPAP